MCALWTRCNNCLRENVTDAVKTLRELCVDAVVTLWGRCVHAITDKFDILGVFHGDPTTRWHGFRTLYKRCGIAVWCDRGFTYCNVCKIFYKDIDIASKTVPSLTSIWIKNPRWKTIVLVLCTFKLNVHSHFVWMVAQFIRCFFSFVVDAVSKRIFGAWMNLNVCFCFCLSRIFSFNLNVKAKCPTSF